MEDQANHNNKDHEGHFYKGLFFGLLLGIGVVWFLGSESGKEFVKKARKRIDEALSTEPGMENFEEGTAGPEPESKAATSTNPRVFFHKNKE
jgi:hypothetical protein